MDTINRALFESLFLKIGFGSVKSGSLLMDNGEAQGPYCLWYASFLLHLLSSGHVLLFQFEILCSFKGSRSSLSLLGLSQFGFGSLVMS